MEHAETPTVRVTDRLLQLLTVGIVLLMICMAVHLMADSTAPKGDARATLIITANTDAVYPVLTDEPPVEDPQGAFEKRLLELKAAHPDAVLVEAGRFLSISTALETGYNVPAITFRHKAGYDVVNLAALDAALGTVGEVIYHRGDAEFLNPVISGFRTRHPVDLEALKGSQHVNARGGLPLTFLSMPDPDRIGGVPGKAVDLTPVEGLQGQDKVMERVASQGRVGVGIGELTGEKLDALVRRNMPQVMVDLEGLAPGAVEQRGESWHIGAPALGEILVVELERRDGLMAQPQVRVERWLPDGTTRQQLEKWPVGGLGERVPNIGHVVQRDLGGDESGAWFDVVPAADLGEVAKTNRRDVHVYHARMPEGERRLYRCRSVMADWSRPGFGDRGFPNLDMIIILDHDHQFQGIVTRVNFPVGMTNSALRDALLLLAGQPEESWQPDPVKAAGIEPIWRWATEEIRRAIAMDRKIYGEGGLLAVSE